MIRPYKTFCVELSPARRHRRQLYLYPEYMDMTIKVWIRIEVEVSSHSGQSRTMGTELELKQEEEDMMG